MATKTQKSGKITEALILDAYVDYVLTEQKVPASIYAFAKMLEITEADIYKFFNNFESMDTTLWQNAASSTVSMLKSSEEFGSYTTREKMLGLFYTLTEHLNQQRSYFIYSLQASKMPLKNAEAMKSIIKDFATEIIQEGLQDKQIEDRKLLSDKYPDAVWLNICFVLGYWMKDQSKGFEKTDAAIEKSVTLMMELMGKSALDSMIDLGKFLLKDKAKPSFKF
jgi:hypothetical protein